MKLSGDIAKSRWQIRKQYVRAAALRDKSYITILQNILCYHGLAYPDIAHTTIGVPSSTNLDAYEDVVETNIDIIPTPIHDEVTHVPASHHIYIHILSRAGEPTNRHHRPMISMARL